MNVEITDSPIVGLCKISNELRDIKVLIATVGPAAVESWAFAERNCSSISWTPSFRWTARAVGGIEAEGYDSPLEAVQALQEKMSNR